MMARKYILDFNNEKMNGVGFGSHCLGLDFGGQRGYTHVTNNYVEMGHLNEMKWNENEIQTLSMKSP